MDSVEIKTLSASWHVVDNLQFGGLGVEGHHSDNRASRPVKGVQQVFSVKDSEALPGKCGVVGSDAVCLLC